MLENSFHPVENTFVQRQPNAQELADIFTSHQYAQDFRLEVDYRETKRQYHLWYEEICRKHQEELQIMADEVNILTWFQQIWCSSFR